MQPIETIKHTLKHAKTLEELKEVQELLKKNKSWIMKMTTQPSQAIVELYEISEGRPEYIPENWSSFTPEVKEEFKETVTRIKKLGEMWIEVTKLEERTTKKIKDIVQKGT